MKKIKLAIPCTEIFKKNFEKFDSLVDVFELRNTLGQINTDKELLFHWSEGILQDNFFEFLKKENIIEFLKKNRIKTFSFDLGPGCRKIESKNTSWGSVYLGRDFSVLKPAELKKICFEKISQLRKIYSGEILFENLNYYPTSAYRYVCEPGFISDIIYNNEAFLLLDIGHLKVSSHNLGFSTSEYIEQLPLNRVKEIHLSASNIMSKEKFDKEIFFNTNSGFRKQNIAYDTHKKLIEDDWDLLKLLIKKCNHLEYIAIEYYGNAEKLFQYYQKCKVITEQALSESPR
jgi:uncharacterized protein